MERDSAIGLLRDGFFEVESLRGLFIGGSLSHGYADEWSDIDFVGIASEEAQTDIAARWLVIIETRTPIVHRMQHRQGAALLLNIVTVEWLRIDLLLVPMCLFSKGRSRDRIQVLFDRDDAAAGLPPALPPRTPDPEKVRGIILEFVRIMGLLPVVAGREEWFIATTGTGLLRGLVQNLLMEEVSEPDRGGALNLKRYLPAHDVALLTSLPYPAPERNAVIQAHAAIARTFMHRARPLSDRLGLEWPDAFITATRRRLLSTLGAAAADW